MIEGVTITPLKRIPDERGAVLHMISRDWPVFTQMGELYFSTVVPGVVKGWHLHQRMILNYAVPIGRIKFVLFDNRAESVTRGEVQETFIGEDNYALVTVPPGIWNGFKGLGDYPSLVANCASIPHDPDEVSHRPARHPDIPYDWAVRHG